MIALGATLIALFLDKLLGELTHWHPLVGFGRWADCLEAKLNNNTRLAGLLAGLLAWLLATVPLTMAGWLIAVYLAPYPLLDSLLGGVVLYLAIGWKSLLEHADNVTQPLLKGDLGSARDAVAMMVSRDTNNLTDSDIAAAATESVLENGSDAIFAPLFWFWVGGIPGVVLYRLSNTLDAMWGYKNSRFLRFGWSAARVDDLLNWIPARLTAAAYALCGNTVKAIRCWCSQAPEWQSPNAGPVMASGAGAINIELGGTTSYHGQPRQRPKLGEGNRAMAITIASACKLVNRTLLLWVVLFAVLVGLIW